MAAGDDLDAEMAQAAKAALTRAGVPMPSAPVSARGAEQRARQTLRGATPSVNLAGAGSTIAGSGSRRHAVDALAYFRTAKEREALGKGLRKMRKSLAKGDGSAQALWAGWSSYHNRHGGEMDFPAWRRLFRGEQP